MRQNRGSERKAVLAGMVRAPQFPLRTSAQQTRDRKRIKKKPTKFIVYSSGPLIDYTDVLITFFFIRLRRRAHVRSGASISSGEVL